jgi:hypothetical protein
MRPIPGAEMSLDPESPSYEYYSIGYGVGYLITVLRMSLGDIDLGSLEYHTLTEQILLYTVIIFIIIVNSIIFLNFIVAHACNTYTIISDQLEDVIMQQKGGLIDEVEQLLTDRFWDRSKFPKHIIVREIQT